MNYPNLLVSWPVFGVAASDEYLDMNRLPRLEYGPTSGAIWDNLFFPRPLEVVSKPTLGLNLGVGPRAGFETTSIRRTTVHKTESSDRMFSKTETGSVLLIALLVMMAVSVLGVLAIQASIVELNLVRNERDIQETFHLSESAALEGVQLLSNIKVEDRQDHHPIWLHSRKKLAASNMDFREVTKWRAQGRERDDNSIKSRFNSESLISAVEWDIVPGGSLVMTEPRLVLTRVYGLCTKHNTNELIEIGYAIREP